VDQQNGACRFDIVLSFSVSYLGILLFLLFISIDTNLLQIYYIGISTLYSHFILEGVAEVTQIFLRDTHVLPKLVSYEEHCRRDRW
jgi:hypothetical protein